VSSNFLRQIIDVRRSSKVNRLNETVSTVRRNQTLPSTTCPSRRIG